MFNVEWLVFLEFWCEEIYWGEGGFSNFYVVVIFYNGFVWYGNGKLFMIYKKMN